MRLKILDRQTNEHSGDNQHIRDYKNAIKMLDSAWNRFNYSGTLSSIYHLKACEERLNEIKKEISNLSITSESIDVKEYGYED